MVNGFFRRCRPFRVFPGQRLRSFSERNLGSRHYSQPWWPFSGCPFWSFLLRLGHVHGLHLNNFRSCLVISFVGLPSAEGKTCFSTVSVGLRFTCLSWSTGISVFSLIFFCIYLDQSEIDWVWVFVFVTIVLNTVVSVSFCLSLFNLKPPSFFIDNIPLWIKATTLERPEWFFPNDLNRQFFISFKFKFVLDPRFLFSSGESPRDGDDRARHGRFLMIDYTKYTLIKVSVSISFYLLVAR